CPINSGDGGATPWGWFLDEIRPTLAVSSPRAGANAPPLAEIRIGTADANSGVAAGSLSVTADFAVAGRAPGSELADLATPVADGVVRIAVEPALPEGTAGRLQARVRDNQGNWTRVDRRFFVGDPPDPPGPPAECDPAPRPCRGADRGQVRLDVARRNVVWVWSSATPFAPGELGDPVSGATTYDLCFYDATGVRLDARVPGGGTCGSLPCWKARPNGGLRYKRADGWPGAPVVLQLVRRDDPTQGLESRFATSAANGPVAFKAKLP